MLFPDEEDMQYILRNLYLDRMPYDVKWELIHAVPVTFSTYEDEHWRFCDHIREQKTGEDHYFKLGGIIKAGLDKDRRAR